jgi:hypothetical protein
MQSFHAPIEMRHTVAEEVREYLVDVDQFPHRSIDMPWSIATETSAADLLTRYHKAMRSADETISRSDEMWNGLNKDCTEYARLHYMYGGRSALKCMVDALLVSQSGVPKSILDFPSAHGRVTRFLKVAFPESELWAGDLNYDGVDFCSEYFGAKPFYSSPDLSAVSLPRKYDLIWCGSLATHLPEPQCKLLFDMLLASLEKDGILCITTCGRGMQYAHENIFSTIDEPAYTKICAELKERSFGFAPYGYCYGSYDSSERYGMAFLYPSWIEKNVLNPAIQVLMMREKAWHGAQDIWCLINRPVSSWYDWARA